MLVPFLSTTSNKRPKYRRAGGGGGGSCSGGCPPPISIGSGSTIGGITTATPFGSGGGRVTRIPSGQPFAGRSLGGGTRSEIYGNRTYGSGYPGTPSRGVSGLGFPFYFWPIVWGSAGAGGVAYLHDTEYGEPNNSSRPGGLLTTVAFSSSSGNTSFHVIADNATTASLLYTITTYCTSLLAFNSTGKQAIVTFDPSNSSMPRPEQAVQYYRASSIVLSLDGYNDTAALNASVGVNYTDAPLPTWVNSSMLNCVNWTIGGGAPLVDAEDTSDSIPFSLQSAKAIGFVWLLIFLVKTLI